jgi:hypothetical protein
LFCAAEGSANDGIETVAAASDTTNIVRDSFFIFRSPKSKSQPRSQHTMRRHEANGLMFDEPAYCATEQTKFIPDKPQASNGDLPVMPQIDAGSGDAAKSIGGSDAAKA